MAIHSYGFAPKPSPEAEKALANFHENLPVLLEHSKVIRDNKKWRSIEMPFAWCSWPYVGGDGPLPLGVLLEGYFNGLFKEPCLNCSDDCYVTIFSGSPLSGSNSWSGFCVTCNEAKRGKDSIHKPFFQRIQFVTQYRKTLEQTSMYLQDLIGLLKKRETTHEADATGSIDN